MFKIIDNILTNKKLIHKAKNIWFLIFTIYTVYLSIVVFQSILLTFGLHSRNELLLVMGTLNQIGQIMFWAVMLYVAKFLSFLEQNEFFLTRKVNSKK